MKEEIKVGEYIRTKNGTIVKIEDEEFDLCTRIPDEKVLYKKWVEDFLGSYTVREEILKHSFNIIDLIEEGDYVNGERVKYLMDCATKEKLGKCIVTSEVAELGDGDYNTIYDYQIKSIVTKEQFKKIVMIYKKIGGEVYEQERTERMVEK